MNEQEWRCSHCGKLLGIVCERRLHLRFARGHEYLVGFPATSVCRGCRTLNEFADPHHLQTVLERHVRVHLGELAEVRPNLR